MKHLIITFFAALAGLVFTSCEDEDELRASESLFERQMIGQWRSDVDNGYKVYSFQRDCKYHRVEVVARPARPDLPGSGSASAYSDRGKWSYSLEGGQGLLTIRKDGHAWNNEKFRCFIEGDKLTIWQILDNNEEGSPRVFYKLEKPCISD